MSTTDRFAGAEHGSSSVLAELGFHDFIGSSPRMTEIYRVLREVAPSSASVLFVGESGTGKELAAKTLHELSPRREGPFVAVNCAAIPETLLEGELFGHERGAFTGATSRQAGCFELAHGGTLFLDELTAMPPDSQTKLLRALEERSFRRLRGSEEIRVDVRVVAAVNLDPERALREGAIREDLYYRINVFQVSLPALRDRKEDIVPLALHFLRAFAQANQRAVETLAPETRTLLKRYPWPGNVRELRNAIERAVILSTGPALHPQHLPPQLRPGSEERVPARETRVSDGAPLVGMSLEQATRWLILRTLESTNYNKTRAAGLLGVSVKTVYNKLREWSALGDVDAANAAGRCRKRRPAARLAPVEPSPPARRQAPPPEPAAG